MEKEQIDQVTRDLKIEEYKVFPARRSDIIMASTKTKELPVQKKTTFGQLPMDRPAVVRSATSENIDIEGDRI